MTKQYRVPDLTLTQADIRGSCTEDGRFRYVLSNPVPPGHLYRFDPIPSLAHGTEEGGTYNDLLNVASN